MGASEVVLLRELRAWYERINTERFGGRLVPPVLALSRRATDLGRWTPGGRTLELSWSLVVDRTWGQVVAVLEHEMAHQYVVEVLGVRDETSHGPTFQRVCAERGIDARAAGTPQDAGEPEPAVVRRIRKLLALADSPVEAEARAAMNAAYRLMLRHNVSLAQTRVTPRYTVRQLGIVTARRQKHEQLLAGLISRHFFVDITIVPAFSVDAGRRGTAVEAAGSWENVEIAAWVWEFVLVTSERLWREHRRAHGLSDGQRRRFLEGVMLGFRDKLAGETQAAQQEGLVWVGDPGLDDYVAGRHPHRRAGRTLRVELGAATTAGRAAGQQLVLRRPIRERGDGVAGALTGPVKR